MSLTAREALGNGRNRYIHMQIIQVQVNSYRYTCMQVMQVVILHEKIRPWIYGRYGGCAYLGIFKGERYGWSKMQARSSMMTLIW